MGYKFTNGNTTIETSDQTLFCDLVEKVVAGMRLQASPALPKSIRLVSAGEKRIQVIKVLRTYLSCTLVEGKNMVEAVPTSIALPPTLSTGNVDSLIFDLRALGCTVEP